MADDGFTALDAWLGRALAALEPGARAKLMRDAAKVLLTRTRRDMAAQQGPDGERWTPRARKTPKKPNGPTLATGTRVNLGYINGGGVSSRRMINIRRIDAHSLEAFDERDQHMKTFLFDRIFDGVDVAALKRSRVRKHVRMMLGLRAARRLAMRRADATGAEIGWGGRDAAIAAVHQVGGVDSVDARHPGLTAEYPARPLLGIGAGDLGAVRAVIVERLAGT